MTRSDTTQSCPYSPHSGPIGCLTAPNMFPLAKESLLKGKCFGIGDKKLGFQEFFTFTTF